MLFYIILFLVISVIAYFYFVQKPTEQLKQTNSQVMKEELEHEEVKEHKEANASKQNQKSFKSLKSSSKAAGKKKGKGSGNPENEHYVSALKGFNSAVVDFDYMIFEDGALLVVVGEESAQVKAFLIKDIEQESNFIQAQGKLQAGINILSVTLGPLRITDSKNFSVLVAVAIFDHCSVNFFELNRVDDKFTFTLLNKKMANIHKIPVKTIRLSKKQPNLLITCGDETDLYLKLWNIASNTTEPVSQVLTNQIRHKFMTQGQENDYFSAVAKTSEIRIHSLTYHQSQLKGLEKVMALTLHKREVMSLSYDQQCKYCVTTAKDQQMIIYSIDSYYNQVKPIFTKAITTLPELSLTSLSVVESQKKQTAYVCIADGQTFEVYCGIIDHDIKSMEMILRVEDAQHDTIQGIQFYYDIPKEELFLITSAKLDLRLNIWKIPQH